MENLSSQELMDLVTFYKQKSTDTEFSLLQTQIRFNKSANIIGELREIVRMHEETIQGLTDLQKSLEQKISDLLAPKPKARKPRS